MDFFFLSSYVEMTLNAQIMNKIWIQQLKSHIGGYWLFSKLIGTAPWILYSMNSVFNPTSNMGYALDPKAGEVKPG